jgi:uncharacterized SAM-binding protein YcdF (DUF218 family)
MGVLSALFTNVVLSPILLVALIVVCAILARRRGPAVWLLSVAGSLVLLLSMPVVASLLLRPLEYRYAALGSAAPRAEAIVVLGGGVRDGSPDEGGEPSLTATTLKRVVYGYRLQRRFAVPLVVCGGTTWREKGAASEADVAKAALVNLGADEGGIIAEGRSTTTWENARNAAALLRARGVSRVLLVTSAWHMPRAMIAFRRAGIACVPAPTDYLSRGGRLTAVDFVPGFGELRDSVTALQEYCGIALYVVRR